jgi:hypothetical protein
MATIYKIRVIRKVGGKMHSGVWLREFGKILAFATREEAQTKASLFANAFVVEAQERVKAAK